MIRRNCQTNTFEKGERRLGGIRNGREIGGNDIGA